jgi:hypothetical protein
LKETARGCDVEIVLECRKVHESNLSIAR